MNKQSLKSTSSSRWIYGFCLALLLFLGTIGHVGAQQPPTEDVSAKVQSFWIANQISDLNTYLSTIYTTYPNYVPAIIASAFYDYVFTGKMNQAVQKLQTIKTDIQTNSQAYSAEFQGRLDDAIREINDDIAYQTNAGRTQAQWQTNANPQAIRSFWGVDFQPILKLGTASPKIYLGQH